MAHSDRFAFGDNWRKFNATVTSEQHQAAQKSLLEWFGDLDGRSFLDVGAGSGLFAAAAAGLGADVRAFDYDPATEQIERGDVLDGNWVRGLGQFDVVYSWGVLHHTGQMWQAIQNALDCVKPGGVALIALYNRPRVAPLQIAMKKLYNGSPPGARSLIKAAWGGAWLLARTVIKRANPVTFLREYPSRNRGMTFWRDVEDWVGGWPFEYTSEGELGEHLAPGFRITRVTHHPPGGCDEYLIARR